MRIRSGWVAAFVALSVVSSADAQTAAGLNERLAEVRTRQKATSQSLSEGLKGSPSPEKRQAVLDRFNAETDRNTEEVLKLVADNPRDPAAVDALGFVIQTARAGPSDRSYRAIAALRDHVREPGMGRVCSRMFYLGHAPEAGALMRAVLVENPSREERGEACHALVLYLQYQARMVRKVRENPENLDRFVHERHRESTARFVKDTDPDSLDREAERLLETVIADYADLRFPNETRTLGEIARGELFASRNLAIGKLAPDVQGKDHEGKTFSLAEYRGKVVVLTFSGNWCGPCVGMYPHERTLAGRWRGKPFALVSVSTDEKVDTLRKSIADGDITWRCWWDGGTNGPITTRWGVSSFPSIFVLDPKGVIRFKGVRDGALDRAVDTLMTESGEKAAAK